MKLKVSIPLDKLELLPFHLTLPSTAYTSAPVSNGQFFGCQRQRGGTSDNPSVLEFCQNTEALRVMDSFCRGRVKGNCSNQKRTIPTSIDKDNTIPLQERPRKH